MGGSLDVAALKDDKDMPTTPFALVVISTWAPPPPKEKKKKTPAKDSPSAPLLEAVAPRASSTSGASLTSKAETADRTLFANPKTTPTGKLQSTREAARKRNVINEPGTKWKNHGANGKRDVLPDVPPIHDGDGNDDGYAHYNGEEDFQGGGEDRARRFAVAQSSFNALRTLHSSLLEEQLGDLYQSTCKALALCKRNLTEETLTAFEQRYCLLKDATKPRRPAPAVQRAPTTTTTREVEQQPPPPPAGSDLIVKGFNPGVDPAVAGDVLQAMAQTMLQFIQMGHDIPESKAEQGMKKILIRWLDALVDEEKPIEARINASTLAEWRMVSSCMVQPLERGVGESVMAEPEAHPEPDVMEAGDDDDGRNSSSEDNNSSDIWSLMVTTSTHRRRRPKRQPRDGVHKRGMPKFRLFFQEDFVGPDLEIGLLVGSGQGPFALLGRRSVFGLGQGGTCRWAVVESWGPWTRRC